MAQANKALLSPLSRLGRLTLRSSRPKAYRLGIRKVKLALEIRRSARLIIVDSDDNLLLFKYHDEHRDPFWATVGGELKPGETYLDTARRELSEETGIDAKIGPLVRERDEIYAVARSTPARWLEKYFLVRCKSYLPINQDGWTDEERGTIRDWKWWSLEDMKIQDGAVFKPEWLPAALESLIHGNIDA